ncbi:MAG: hypothetical protein E3J21_05700 [Anaerolineales bacterium]|nr:MAG: hypothetical protein E3J21_05700 [Anaerolineales bacterium]
MMTAIESEREELLKLYELAINEHHYYLDAHQKRIDFYTGILSALLTGAVVGLFQASEPYHFACLCIAPVLIYAVSRIAIEGTFRVYQRLLETVTVRAKIEQELGLTSRQPDSADDPDPYWRSEPIIPYRHIESRKKYESSKAFIDAHITKGLQLWARCLFRVFQWVGIGLGLLTLVIWKVL